MNISILLCLDIKAYKALCYMAFIDLSMFCSKLALFRDFSSSMALTVQLGSHCILLLILL